MHGCAYFDVAALVSTLKTLHQAISESLKPEKQTPQLSTGYTILVYSCQLPRIPVMFLQDSHTAPFGKSSTPISQRQQANRQFLTHLQARQVGALSPDSTLGQFQAAHVTLQFNLVARGENSLGV